MSAILLYIHWIV